MTEADIQEMDDVFLIRRFAEEADREALGLLFRRHADMAYRMAMRYLRNASEAEDAVQMAFVKVMQQAGDYRGAAGVRSWVMRIVAGTCVDMIKSSVRRRTREQRVFEEQPAEEGAAAESGAELALQARQALEALPELYRVPVWLHHYEGLPFCDVATAMSLP